MSVSHLVKIGHFGFQGLGIQNKGDEHINTWLKEHACRGGADDIDVCIILKSYLDNNSLHALMTAGPAGKKVK